MCAGFLNPKIIGPTDSDPSICFNNLYVMLADSKLGKIKTLTFLPFNLEADDLRARFKVPEWGVFCHLPILLIHPACFNRV